MVKAEEIIRASGARADLNKAIIAADLDRAALVGVSGESFRVRSSGEPAYVGALSLENLNLFFTNKIKKLKYEYALKNLSDIDYFDIDVYNNFIDLYNKYLTKGAEIKPVPSPSLGSAGAAETYDINTAKSYIDHLYLRHSLRASNFKKFA